MKKLPPSINNTERDWLLKIGEYLAGTNVHIGVLEWSGYLLIGNEENLTVFRVEKQRGSPDSIEFRCGIDPSLTISGHPATDDFKTIAQRLVSSFHLGDRFNCGDKQCG